MLLPCLCHRIVQRIKWMWKCFVKYKAIYQCKVYVTTLLTGVLLF